MAGLVAKDLAEWKCWGFVPKFTAIVHSSGSRLNAYRNGFLYYLVCSRNRDDGMAQPLPANGWLRDPLLYFPVIGVALFAARHQLIAAGVAVALFVAVSLLAGRAASVRALWARAAVRVAGSWIVAIGLLMPGWAMRVPG